MKINIIQIFLLFIILLISLITIKYFFFYKEDYENIDYLQLNHNNDSQDIESSNYYNSDNVYIKGTYPQEKKVKFMTYTNDKEPVWAKAFKWCSY